MNIKYFLILIVFYFIGAAPFGYLLSKIKGRDITKEGSGSVGATNVARNLGKKAGLIVLTLDILKGFLPLFILSKFNCQSLTYFAAFFLVAGHCFSIPPLLRGGKGVATATGVFLFLNPSYLVLSFIVFVLTFILSKFVSLSSIISSISFPLFILVFSEDKILLMASLCIVSIIVMRHHENVSRLIKGEEKRFKFA